MHPGAGDFADFAVANEVGTQPQPSPASSSEGLASLAVQADGGIATPSHCPTVLKVDRSKFITDFCHNISERPDSGVVVMRGALNADSSANCERPLGLMPFHTQ